MNLSNSSVLITGASQGIGRALAQHFARRCRHTIVTGRSETGLHHTVELIRMDGGSCDFVVSDLTSRESIESLVASLREKRISLGALIHNAANVTSKPLAATSLEEIDSLVRTNLTGPLQLTRESMDLWHPDGMKTIVFISSLAGYKPNPAQTVYSITKAGVNAAARALRAELAPLGFTIINAPLSSVDLTGIGAAGSVAVDRVCRRIEKAIIRREDELFLSLGSRVLMRVYGLFPGLMRH